MTEHSVSERRSNDLWRMLPGVLVSLAALVIVFYFADLEKLKTAWQRVDYRYFLIILPVYLVSYAARSLAWRVLLKDEVPFGRVFLTMHAGYLLNNTLPFRLGELGRAFILGRSGLGFWRVFSTILIERAFDMIFASGLLLGTLPFVLGAPGARQVAYVVGGFVLLGLVVLHFVARYQDWALAQYQRLAERWPKMLVFGKERLEAFFEGLAALVNVKRFLRVLAWMTLSWVLAVSMLFLTLRAFFPAPEVLWAAFVQGMSALGVAVPSSPGYIGVYEATVVGSLALFDVDLSVALAFALTCHLMYIAVTTFFGAYALAREGEALGSLYRRIRERRTGD
jgi:uncharacterized protein (TIRG00374 family)